ncbi:hypothetical protein TorRG33x02_277110 [Trema orientale]|uniref:Uncharacterized protein n=1 Tax=Trema orientale TaxID=63057 RepID=A0A2P5CQ39_TREOI|nr:hypothetical protein TorRG33x02_277110 [Trema orientale]
MLGCPVGCMGSKPYLVHGILLVTSPLDLRALADLLYGETDVDYRRHRQGRSSTTSPSLTRSKATAIKEFREDFDSRQLRRVSQF